MKKKFNTIIFAGFPGIGKTYFKSISNKVVCDLDSSNFSRINDKRNPLFPKNYIDSILDKIGKCDYLLISIHSEMRYELDKLNINYIIVIPDRNDKKEYIDRIKRRNENNDNFIERVNNLWDKWIDDIEKSDKNIIILNKNEYFSDFIKKFEKGDRK